MRRWQQWTLGVAAIAFGISSYACSTGGSFTKAPITELATGGAKSERQQQFLLRRLKWEHRGSAGRVTGVSFFTDTARPIAGARPKDTLYIKKGAFEGSYTVKQVLRLVDTDSRGKRRRQVIVEIAGQFFDPSLPRFWKVLHRGSGGISLENNTFTDAKSFLPEVPIGTQVLIRTGGSERAFTVVKTLADKFGLQGLQRVGYVFREELPKGLQNLTYQVRSPTSSLADKLAYRIHWRGSGLTGHNFTLGINRRRYRQREVNDLLRSNPTAKKRLASVGGKRSAAIVMQVTGGVAVAIGGFLALVRRDDFPGTQQIIPWSIAGGGLALLLGSIPLNVSANNDYLAAAKAYNKDLIRRLDITPPKDLAEKSRPTSPQQKRLVTPGPTPSSSAKASR